MDLIFPEAGSDAEVSEEVMAVRPQSEDESDEKEEDVEGSFQASQWRWMEERLRLNRTKEEWSVLEIQEGLHRQK